MSDFIPGDIARLSVTITDTAGTLVDPGGLSLVAHAPDGTTSTNAVAKDSTGKYHFDLPLTQAGDYMFRWVATGQFQGVEQGGLYVKPLDF